MKLYDKNMMKLYDKNMWKYHKRFAKYRKSYATLIISSITVYILMQMFICIFKFYSFGAVFSMLSFNFLFLFIIIYAFDYDFFAWQITELIPKYDFSFSNKKMCVYNRLYYMLNSKFDPIQSTLRCTNINNCKICYNSKKFPTEDKEIAKFLWEFDKDMYADYLEEKLRNK